MVEFKCVIADPKTGKAYSKELKDEAAKTLMGMNLGESLKGDAVDLQGYELQITGGSDFCGFPMRRGILGVRKRIAIKRGVGLRINTKGGYARKTICGHKINENIHQVNFMVLKEGPKPLADIFPPAQKKESK